MQRLRRNRKSEAIRSLVQETRLHPSQLILPYFIVEGSHQQQPIESLPGVFRLSIDNLLKDVETAYALGIRAINLFPLIPIEKKDRDGSEALRQGNLVQQAIFQIKKALPEICVMVDIALDPTPTMGMTA